MPIQNAIAVNAVICSIPCVLSKKIPNVIYAPYNRCQSCPYVEVNKEHSANQVESLHVSTILSAITAKLSIMSIMTDSFIASLILS